jgi:hypothetical protein
MITSKSLNKAAGLLCVNDARANGFASDQESLSVFRRIVTSLGFLPARQRLAGRQVASFCQEKEGTTLLLATENST